MLVRCYAPTPVLRLLSFLHPQVRTLVRETIHTSVSGHAEYEWSVPGWEPKILGEPTRYLKPGPAYPPATHRSRPLLKLTLSSTWRCLISQKGVFHTATKCYPLELNRATSWSGELLLSVSIQKLMTASHGTVERIPDRIISGHFHSTTLSSLVMLSFCKKNNETIDFCDNKKYFTLLCIPILSH